MDKNFKRVLIVVSVGFLLYALYLVKPPLWGLIPALCTSSCRVVEIDKKCTKKIELTRNFRWTEFVFVDQRNRNVVFKIRVLDESGNLEFEERIDFSDVASKENQHSGDIVEICRSYLPSSLKDVIDLLLNGKLSFFKSHRTYISERFNSQMRNLKGKLSKNSSLNYTLEIIPEGNHSEKYEFVYWYALYTS